MKKLVLASLLLTGCGYLPQITPAPTVTVTATVTVTPEAKAPESTPSAPAPTATKPPVTAPNVAGGDNWEIRFEGKKGTKITGGYVVFASGSPTQVEEVEGVLPFSVKFQHKTAWSVSAGINDFSLTDDVKPKVFVLLNGKDCGTVSTTGSKVKNPEASKGCAKDL